MIGRRLNPPRTAQRWLGVLALSVPSLAACGIVSGLDHLENADCVGPCGEDNVTPNEAGASDVGSPDADSNGGDDTSNVDATSADATTDSTQLDATSADAASTDAKSSDASSSDAASADVHTDTGPTCANDLSNVGLGDFRIAFSVNTTQSGLVAALNQRVACGTQTFWDVRILNGHLYVETDDGTSFTTLSSTATINNGQLHEVVVQRVALTLSISIDGQASGSTKAKASLSALPPLLTGTDPCQSPNPGSDETVAFAGTLKNVCVLRL